MRRFYTWTGTDPPPQLGSGAESHVRGPTGRHAPGVQGLQARGPDLGRSTSVGQACRTGGPVQQTGGPVRFTGGLGEPPR